MKYQERNYLGWSMETAGVKAQYDTYAKRIISDRTILSWIAKYTIEELANYSIEEIRDCIDGEPEVAVTPVYPGSSVSRAGEHVAVLSGRKNGTDAVTGLSTEDNVPNEGKITYDVRFFLRIPSGDKIKIIVNIELQKDFYPGYDLVTRALFYCARMLSSQLDTEFTADNYNDIKKVSPLHSLLGTIFSVNLNYSEKETILNNDYQIETTKTVKEGMHRMCNLSDAIEERGIMKGIAQGLKRGEVNKLIEQICRKMQKNKDVATIAEELEEAPELIQQIYDVALTVAPDYDKHKISKLLHMSQKV